MEENRMHKKNFTQELEGTRRRGRPRKRWKEVERNLQVLGESWRQIGKSNKIFFDRPKPTAGCSANGRRRRRSLKSLKSFLILKACHCIF
jgi:hypothetical protein